MEYAREIQTEQGITILLTTHFIEEADRCDYLSLCWSGKIIDRGSPEELKRKLTFKSFLLRPKDMGHVKKILRIWSVSRKAGKWNAAISCAAFQCQPDFSCELSSSVEELIYRDPSLEDVFIHQTGSKIQ
ncbi:MAG: hypothetical protein R2877_07525 [Bdellovibrionota bacterium]